jgi:hypothetical protein
MVSSATRRSRSATASRCRSCCCWAVVTSKPALSAASRAWALALRSRTRAVSTASRARWYSTSAIAPCFQASSVPASSRVGLALRGQLLPARRDAGAAALGVELGQRRALALELVGQLRRVEGRQRVALLHGVAGADRQGHGARHRRVQRRADRGDHPAGHRRVAHQRAAGDLGDSQPGAVDRSLAGQPAADHQHRGGDRRRGDHGAEDPAREPAAGALDDPVLARRVADGHRRRGAAGVASSWDRSEHAGLYSTACATGDGQGCRYVRRGPDSVRRVRGRPLPRPRTPPPVRGAAGALGSVAAAPGIRGRRG